jgi:hypothetical protein
MPLWKENSIAYLKYHTDNLFLQCYEI